MRFKDFISTEDAAKSHYLVVGHPIGHSLSPLMHQIAIDYHDLPGRYIAIDLEPDELPAFIAWLNRDELKGVNVTIPYKQEFLQVVDHLDGSAESVGALNTVVKSQNGLTGYNTDVDGFLKPLKPYLDVFHDESAVVFGTGGASRAVIFALRESGIRRIILVSRSPGRFKENKISDDNLEFVYCHYHNWQAYTEDSALFVNCTPLGMYPKTELSPVDQEDAKLLKGKICYDLVYNPRLTRFLKMAGEQGAETIGGLEMFIAQGNRAFELWTGKRFPDDKIRKVLLEKLSSSE